MRLNDLKKFNRKQIQQAGTRYSPGVDPNAPNLQIKELIDAINGIGATDTHRNCIGAVIEPIRKASWAEGNYAEQLHAAVNLPLSKYLKILEAVRDGKPKDIQKCLATATRWTAELLLIIDVVEDMAEEAAEVYRRSRETPSPASKAEEQANSTAHTLRTLAGHYRNISEVLTSPSMRAFSNAAIFILGGWGTGKTHLLCDVAKIRGQQNQPTMLVLAHHIPPDVPPLDGLAILSGLAATGKNLIRQLAKLGQATGTRALLIIDAINEGDRDAWRKHLASVADSTSSHPWLGIILSCREPFDELIAPNGLPPRFVAIRHKGFEGIELEAQEAFFTYAGIPFPEVPLLSEEFARPLMLKVICEAFQGLKKKEITKGFEGIASGQKSMTFVLEMFIKRMGSEIGRKLSLSPDFFWYLLKGSKQTRSRTHTGIALEMAARTTESLPRKKVLSLILDHLPTGSTVSPKAVLQQCAASGILVEDVVWTGSSKKYDEIIRLPYQRFSDHLIARHLMLPLEVCKTAADVRAALLPTSPLGKVFEPMPYGYSYQNPGLAEAIVAEFPERVVRSLPEDEREIYFYLPTASQVSAYMQRPFLNSLVWRSAKSITAQTDKLLGGYIWNVDQWSQHEFFDTMMVLATKKKHPYSALRLWTNLEKFELWNRDITWTEFLRYAGESSAPNKICTWIEKNLAAIQSSDIAHSLIVLLSLLLTSTIKDLRDRATRALVLLGERHMPALFEHARLALELNDPYVRERMLAASYGALMNEQTRIGSPALRGAVCDFAEFLYLSMFEPGAKFATHHILMREYALGFIMLAERAAGFQVKRAWRKNLKKPYPQILAPFPDANLLPPDMIKSGEEAIGMDFGNYTIGYMVDGRSNYDFKHPEYVAIRKQIAWRIADLGFSKERFGQIDNLIARTQSVSRGEYDGRVDRYGKKYGWIAYHEAYGYRGTLGLLYKHADHRPSEMEIDPCFPNGAIKEPFPKVVEFPVGDIGMDTWLRKGPSPDLEALLVGDRVAGIPGPWVMMDCYLSPKAPDDPREMTVSCRGMMVRPDQVAELHGKFLAVDHPSNADIPNPGTDRKTFMGEVPWSPQFADWLTRHDRRQMHEAMENWIDVKQRRKIKPAVAEILKVLSRREIESARLSPIFEPGKTRVTPEFAGLVEAMEAINSRLAPHAKVTMGDLFSLPSDQDVTRGYTVETTRRKIPGMQVELPAFHIELEGNPIMRGQGDRHLPAPRICSQMGLRYGGRDFGMVDASGKAAAIAIRSPDGSPTPGTGLYLRSDILDKYLMDNGIVMTWVIWGEREYHYEHHEKRVDPGAYEKIWQARENLHRGVVVLGAKNALTVLNPVSIDA
ncbi:hypothetical protein [Ferrovibrio sp.]|uniref:hypothetical protein n=1 Tax=Ferrovibrio sp. TaxID=1917215 RepID=UPI000CAAF5D0|nr:hypothetical protein [Ferrovibrio sp.]PJI41847.1 MAG: hypothetical protein CTR53_05130 [Ferrovibrio sp.]